MGCWPCCSRQPPRSLSLSRRRERKRERVARSFVALRNCNRCVPLDAQPRVFHGRSFASTRNRSAATIACIFSLSFHLPIESLRNSSLARLMERVASRKIGREENSEGVDSRANCVTMTND